MGNLSHKCTRREHPGEREEQRHLLLPVCLERCTTLPGGAKRTTHDQADPAGQHEVRRTEQGLDIFLDPEERMPDEIPNATPPKITTPSKDRL
jgi:hypothetical protein